MEASIKSHNAVFSLSTPEEEAYPTVVEDEVCADCLNFLSVLFEIQKIGSKQNVVLIHYILLFSAGKKAAPQN